MADKLIDASAVLFIITVIAFALILLRQHSHLQPTTYRLAVLSTRSALMLPLCALFLLLSVVYPSLYVMMMVLIVIVEGYCMYAFLALITTNLGGPTAVVEHVDKFERQPICRPVVPVPVDHAQFYRWTVWATFHTFALRGVICLISALCFYADTRAGKQAYVVYNFLSALVLVYGVACLIALYENVYQHCINLFGVLKLALLQITAGAIALQALVENVLFARGNLAYSDDDAYSAEDKSIRAVCGLLLLELALLSVAFYYAFGDHQITPSSAPAAVRAFLLDRRSPARASLSGVRAVETIVFSLSRFVWDVLDVGDILKIGYFHVEVEGDGNAGLSEPLTGAVDAEDSGSPRTRDAPPKGNPAGGASRWIMGTLASYVSPNKVDGSAPWARTARGGGAGSRMGTSAGQRYSAVPSGAGDGGDEEFSLPTEDEERALSTLAGGPVKMTHTETPLSPLVGMGQVYPNSPGVPTHTMTSVSASKTGTSTSAGGNGAGAVTTPPRAVWGRPSSAQQPQQEQVTSPFVDYGHVYGGGDQGGEDV